ncbi:flagellar hook assembly protein FlgD [Lentibacillus cibarius]|nr:flagellar hook assembly protein FlgD [Lentibacillus cibarius]
METMTSIDSSLYLHNKPAERVPNPNLGKDEFIQILMTQLQNQDPTNPMKNNEFISQMASFSSLEQMMNMTNSIDKLVQNQTVSPIMQYSNLIGKEISYQRYDNETGEKLDIETSNVVAVSQDKGQAILSLENGTDIKAGALTRVSEPDDQIDATVNPDVSSGSGGSD